MSLYGEYGSSKIGRTIVAQITAIGGWTPITLEATQAGRMSRWTSFVVKSAGTVYIAQGNASLAIGGVVVTLPVNPATATAGDGPGFFELGANFPWRVDVEGLADRVLWFWVAVDTVVRITELTAVQFDSV